MVCPSTTCDPSKALPPPSLTPLFLTSSLFRHASPDRILSHELELCFIASHSLKLYLPPNSPPDPILANSPSPTQSAFEGNKPLAESDPIIAQYINEVFLAAANSYLQERTRQTNGLELIASEVDLIVSLNSRTLRAVR